jgi:hypothetical protein
MAYCYDNALPHSHFLGGPYEWTAPDQVKKMAFALERTERCPNCGTSPWEWQADPEAYVAITEQCLGCLRRESLSEETSSNNQKGTRVTLIPKVRAEAIARNPEAYAVDSPAIRRARRRERQQ